MYMDTPYFRESGESVFQLEPRAFVKLCLARCGVSVIKVQSGE